MNALTFFSIIVCQNDAERVVPIRLTRITIESKGASQRPIVRVTSTDEPRIRRVDEVGVVRAPRLIIGRNGRRYFCQNPSYILA